MLSLLLLTFTNILSVRALPLNSPLLPSYDYISKSSDNDSTLLQI